MNNDVVSAAGYSLDALANLFVRSFAGYFYPVQVNAEQLAMRVRTEQIDLAHSLVLLHDGEPAGLALLGVRDRHVWCGGFGVCESARGQGLSHTLARAMVAQAATIGAQRFSLEVLTRNTAAIATYRRAGLEQIRDLVLLEWQRGDVPRPDMSADVCEQVTIADLLPHMAALRPEPPAWQRDLPSLLARSRIFGLALRDGDAVRAYVLFSVNGDNVRLEDYAASDAESGAMVLRSLQGYSGRIFTVNEPASSPLTAAFLECGFAEVDRQHEMAMGLD